MDTSFLKMIAGNRLSNYLGLKMDEGYAYKFPEQIDRSYAYIEMPVKELYNPSTEEVVTKGLRNQHIQVIPPCTINIRGNYRFEVQINPAFWEYGPCQGMFYLEPGDSGRPSFYISLRKDLDLTNIDWAIRIYMRV